MNRKRMLAALLSLSVVVPALAADPAPTAGAPDADDAKMAPAPDKDEEKEPEKTPPATPNPGTSKQVSKLAAEFNVPPQEITDLRGQGLGWGEIRNALAISRKANVPVGDVVKLRQSGMGWGKIAQKFGFKLGDVVGRTHGEAGTGAATHKGAAAGNQGAGAMGRQHGGMGMGRR